MPNPTDIPMPGDDAQANGEQAGKLHAEQFMRLFLRNGARIHSFILALVPNWSDADDLLQETAAVLWRRFDEYESGSNFVAWALTVARFQVMAHRKKFATRSKLGLSDATVDQLADRVVAKAEQPDVRVDALRSCMGKLSEEDQTLVKLRYEPGASTQDVADATDRSVHAIYKALNRIHRSLMQCIRGQLGPDHRWSQPNAEGGSS